MAKYEALDKFLKDKKIKPKTKVKPSKAFATMSTAEKDTLLEKILKDNGYI